MQRRVKDCNDERDAIRYAQLREDCRAVAGDEGGPTLINETAV